MIPFHCLAKSNYKMTINGRIIQTKKEIIVIDHTCYLSLDDLDFLLSDEYELWQKESDLSVVIKNEKEISYAVVDHQYAVIKSKIKKISAAPVWYNGNLYLPVSFCAQVSGHYLIKSKSYLQFFKWS